MVQISQCRSSLPLSAAQAPYSALKSQAGVQINNAAKNTFWQQLGVVVSGSAGVVGIQHPGSAGRCACMFRKSKSKYCGDEGLCPPGSAAAPPTSQGIDPVFETGIAFSKVGFWWKDTAKGTRQLRPGLSRSVTPTPCSGCIGRCQEIIICAAVASRTVSPLGKALRAGLHSHLRGRMLSPSQLPRCFRSTWHLWFSVQFAGTGYF